MTSFILDRQHELIERLDADLTRALQGLPQAETDLPKRKDKLVHLKAKLDNTEADWLKTLISGGGVPNQSQTQRLWRLTQNIDKLKLEIKSQHSSIDIGYSNIAYWQKEISRLSNELAHAQGLRAAAEYRHLKDGVIVSAAASEMIVELATGGHCRVGAEAIGADSEMTWGGDLALTRQANPYDGLIGLRITEVVARDNEGVMCPEIRFTDDLIGEGFAYATRKDENGKRTGSEHGALAVELCDFAHPAPADQRPGYEPLTMGGRDILVEQEHFARRHMGNLEILRVSNQGRASFHDMNKVDVEIIYSDSHRVRYGNRQSVLLSELGDPLVTDPVDRHIGWALEMLGCAHSDRPLKSALQRIHSHDHESYSWGFDSMGGWGRYIDEDDESSRQGEYQAIRARIVQQLGIAHLERSWSWV